MLIIDRFEGEYAVIENGDSFENVLRNELPPDAAEGDVLSFIDGKWHINAAETESRRKRIREKMERLKGKL